MLTSGCGEADSVKVGTKEHFRIPLEGAEMDVLMDELRVQMRLEGRWYGTQTMRSVRAQVEGLTEDTDDLKRFGILSRCAGFESRVGNEERAIELRISAYEMLPSLGDRLPLARSAQAIFQLGVCYMRLGETENCCLLKNPDSCIAPIRGAGIHENMWGSKNAIKLFTEVLEHT
jgi:hypothetical protein